MARGDKKDYQAATFRLPPDLLDMLEIESTGSGMAKGAIVERALREWLAGRHGPDSSKTEEKENGTLC